MASNRQNGWLNNFGEKVRQGAQVAAKAKAIWDVGRTIYTGAQALAPYAAAGLAML